MMDEDYCPESADHKHCECWRKTGVWYCHDCGKTNEDDIWLCYHMDEQDD